MINWLKHKFLGEQMATANYTEAMTDKMVAQYEANPTRETVEALAKELGKNTRSVIAKLSREGVYQAQPRTTKTGEPIVRKAELLAQIESTLGVEFPSLVKATKADLQRLIDTISD
jgi:N-methylhydantoinase B/oxoprolinase/acetone carboxylase alpha subunit